ncbi:V-type ATPase subunit [bacterium]|nr:V-type ATPase subunit [bacterium]
MADSFEIAYLYAKVCGAFSNMYLGEKGAALARESSLASIWKLYFEGELPDRSEAWILAALERKVVERSMERFSALAGPLAENDRFMGALVAKHEITAIKRFLYKLAAGEARPEHAYFDSSATKKALAAWPRLADMFADGPYQWIDEAALENLGSAENRLDRQYYRSLWASVASIPKNRRGNIPALVLKDIRYQNLAWALRIRAYYGYAKEAAIPLLVALDDADALSLALDTFSCDLGDLRSFDVWQGRRLLERQTGPRLDLPLLENALQRDLFASTRRSLHLHPFGYTPLYCYFAMLEAEAAVILGILEGIRLKAPEQEKIDLAWALSGENV